jgi:urea transporter
VKNFLKDLFDRAWNSWGSTLIGIVCAVGVQVVDSLTNLTATWGLPSWLTAVISAVLVMAGAFFKSHATEPPPK